MGKVIASVSGTGTSSFDGLAQSTDQLQFLAKNPFPLLQLYQ